ncbi:MAG: MoxR family ATPase [bacterium]
MLLEKLGIFGWKQEDEDLVLASLLTGDPLLLVGNHGCAKTHLANTIARALSRPFLVYDASKAMFEDVLGFPNIEKLKQGVVEYVPSKVTVWDKELILIDELNRAMPELQSKWLEIIRSRKIMGFDTNVKWVWAAMNPLSYSATQALDEALIGRFATFLYPPDVLQMNEEDRIKVTTHINGDDAPSISVWSEDPNLETVTERDTGQVGQLLNRILKTAAKHFSRLRSQLPTLSEFLAKFADLLMRETQGEVSLDGRRLGFIYRNILANRSIQLAKAELLKTLPAGFAESARYVVQSSIPIGLNDESLKREETVHKMEICFDLLSAYFGENSEVSKVDLIYELFTTDNLMRKANILLKADLGDFVNSKAWNDLMKEDNDITLLAYTALQVEAHRPGTVPQELLEGLGQKIISAELTTESIPALQNESVEYIEEVEDLLSQETDLGRLVAYNRVWHLVDKGNVTPATIAKTEAAIEADIAIFHDLINQARQGKEEVS